ncbi:hypothetical protein Hamer_G030535, partial [Homarus americanus]
MGLKMKFSAIRYFPYNDYTPDSSEPGSTREEIDIGMPTAPAVERSVVLDNFGAYQADVVCPVSLKPTLLPQYLSLIRPFAGELWGGLLLSVLAWGVVMWLLQNAWWWVTGDRGVKFSTALLYGWAVLLERSTSNPPVNDSGRPLTATEGLHKVLEGRNSFITPRFYITVVIDSHYTDSYGQSPFYISKTGIKIIAAFGWSFRKGAPYYRRFHQMVLRLTDAGIIQHWTDDVIARRVKENRAAAALAPIAT